MVTGMPMYYRLDERKIPHPVALVTEADWSEAARRVRWTGLFGVSVSTIFLVLDHNWDWVDRRPVLFETMVFGGPLDESQWQYRTWDEAVAGHWRAVRMVLWEPWRRMLAGVKQWLTARR